MYPSLDDVEFLSRSSSRVEALNALNDGSRTRDELREVTGASRMTVYRILNDLEAHGWIIRKNGHCELTHQGALITDEFTRLLSNLAVAKDLGDALSWLPIEAFDFDLAHLQDATVMCTSSWEDHTGAVRHVADLVSDATSIWGTATGVSHAVADAIQEATVEGDAQFDVVIDEVGIDMIRRDEELTNLFRDVVNSDNATVRRYYGDTPLHLVVGFDESVAICGHVDGGPPSGTLETAEETVRKWAVSYYQYALNDAMPITVETLNVDHHGAV